MMILIIGTGAARWRLRRLRLDDFFLEWFLEDDVDDDEIMVSFFFSSFF